MIETIEIRHFKRFAAQSFKLEDAVVLAGPNNAGKSTLLQAISTWKLGLDRWTLQRKGGNAAKRTGASISRADFTAVPLREMNLLWADRRVSGGGDKPGIPRLIEITVHGRTRDEQWTCGLEFQYANPELVYVRPRDAKNLEQESIQNFPPVGASELKIVHVPPLSGIERDEPRRDRGMQDLLIGQGRPGEILRNLLWEIGQESDGKWSELTEHVRNLFKVTIAKPVYTPAQPFIVCEYTEPGRERPLDLANVGSGTLQVLLLLAFLYARPASVILLDEPDAHQHIILQKQVYELVRKVAADRGGQVIVATHSEVILDATEPARVIGFLGKEPRPLASSVERDRLREALKRITTTDILLGEDIGSVLYVEGESDEKILTEWARTLGHPALKFLERPFVYWLGGRSLQAARDHFFALRAAFPEMRALCLLDGDNKDEPDQETLKAGLKVLRWRRYEIENYLIHPESIKRFVSMPLFEGNVDEEFRRQVPEAADLFGDHPVLVRVKASTEFLLPFLEKFNHSTPKKDLYLLASRMEPDEIHPEVAEKLDAIADALV